MFYHLKAKHCTYDVSKFKHCKYLNYSTRISIKSHEKGLITKECIIAYMHLAITRFNSGTKLFQAVINTTTYDISQSLFQCFATCTLLKLKRFVLLVMYSM